VPRQIAAILYAAMSEHLVGNVRKLHAQAKVLEYISALTGHVTKIRNEKITSREDAIREARERLRHLNGEAPTLDELARRYGMTARALNEGFKRLFGQSVFAVITDQRLQEAHEVLLKTDLPIKILAANLGYSHVNNFSAAFSKKFGYSPGSLRGKQ
jgi:AraC-like DNA-binding protein